MAKQLIGIKKSNRKIKNATPIEYDNIKFRSQLEKTIYVNLLKKGIKASYEPYRIKIWDSNKFNTPYYDRVGKQGFKLITSKPLPVHYTPDFIFIYNNIKVFLEVKGFKNDVTPYKIRLFRQWLDKNQTDACYAVVHSLGDLNILLSELNKTNE